MVSFKQKGKAMLNNTIDDFQAAGSNDKKGGLNNTTAQGTTEKGTSLHN